MEKVKQWFKSGYRLSEESQPTGILFSFLSAPRSGSIQCHPWVKCRDFLHDAVKTALNKNECTIYGFNYGPKLKGCAPIDLRRTRMIVSQNNMLSCEDDKKVADFDLKMRYAKRLINYYEKIAGVGYTKTMRCKEGKINYWIFNGPSFWQKSPALISLFTFLIRLGDKKIEFDTEEDLQAEYKKLSSGPSPDKDGRYLKTVADKIRKVVERASEVLITDAKFDPDYFENIIIGTFHNNSGIVSLCNGNYINKLKSTTITKK